jgi:NADH-quinone oxidoreductase subunit J
MNLPAIDWQAFYFLLFSLVAGAFALGVVFSNNIVRMAFYLVISLGATSGLFFLAGAEFVGAMQLMIYVGGTLVLLVFGVMLTARETFISMKTRAGDWILSAVLGAALLGLLLRTGYSMHDWHQPRTDRDQLTATDAQSTAQIGMALAGARVDKLEQPDPTLRAGMSGYVFPFVIISMHLLVVLIGAGYLARTKRRVSSTPAT